VHTSPRALYMCPRACAHVLGLMCVPCGVRMYLGASVRKSFRSMCTLFEFIRASFRFVLAILNPWAPFLDPCALLLDLCINYWSMSLPPWQLHGSHPIKCKHGVDLNWTDGTFIGWTCQTNEHINNYVLGLKALLTIHMCMEMKYQPNY
jgi:hypothetical protein